MPYRSGKVRVSAVPGAGGSSLWDKLRVFVRFPGYAQAILRELSRVDAVHIRAPANISLLAMVLLAFVRRPTKRWIKYAGNWQPQGREPLSYRFQRWWLERNFARAKVTVNGRWPEQPPHIVTFPNPCLTEEQLKSAHAIARSKRLYSPAKLLFAGTLLPEKGARLAIDAFQVLRESGVQAELAIAGDGPARLELEDYARRKVGPSDISFLGYVAHMELFREFEYAHFAILPSSSSEGWPKVLGEGMAHGAVPIASAVSSIPQVLAEAGCGRAVASFDPHEYARAILDYLEEPERWRREVEAGCAYAERFTYEAHVQRVKDLLGLDENP
ncbi:MAG: glycosyltransferase [Acidobacteriota bacterium]